MTTSTVKPFEQIANDLRSAIQAGEYEDGARIPTQEQFVKKYGVARMTVQQGLAVLRREGLIISRAGAGAYVNNPKKKKAGGKTLVRPAAKKASSSKEAIARAEAPKKVSETRHPQFDKFLEEVLNDPAAAASFEDAQTRARLSRQFVALRTEHALSQRQLGTSCGYGQADIAKIENGTTLSVATLQRVARAMGAKLVVTLEH